MFNSMNITTIINSSCITIHSFNLIMIIIKNILNLYNNALSIRIYGELKKKSMSWFYFLHLLCFNITFVIENKTRMAMERIYCDDVERTNSSVRSNQAEDRNSIWKRVNEWNQVLVITKQKIKIQSGSRWMN